MGVEINKNKEGHDEHFIIIGCFNELSNILEYITKKLGSTGI